MLGELPWYDRVFPWRRRRRLDEQKVDAEIDRLGKTVNGFKKEHGLDQLMINIEQVRAQGEAAMEAATDERQEEQERQPPQRERRVSRPG